MRRCGGVATTLFLSLAACGETVTYTDAALQTDADLRDAVATGQVTVTTHSRCCDRPPGELVADIDVLVVNRDGSAGESGVTDSTGTITFDNVEAGAAITAIYPVDSGFDLVTVAGVRPGDDLVFGESYTGTATGVDGTMTATWPVVPGTYYYYVYHPCGAGYAYGETTTSTTLYQYASCQTPDADLVFVAYDTSYTMTNVTVLRGVAYTNGQTATLPAWTTGAAFTTGVTGVPAFVPEVQLGANAYVGAVGLGNYGYQVPEAGAASATVTLPASTDRIAAFTRMYRQGDLGPQESYRTLAPDATSTTFEAHELPWLGHTFISASGEEAEWVQTGEMPYDGAVVYAQWTRNPLDLFGGVPPGDYSWTILLPPGVTSWSWDEPPAALADHLPAIGDTVYGDVILVDLASADGFDGLRGTPEWIFGCPSCASSNGDLDGDASVAYSYDGGEGFAAVKPTARPPWMRKTTPQRASR